MAYIDARLPISIEKGASGGPTFNTTIHTLASGYEQRNQNWSHPLGKWDVSYGIRNKQDSDGLNTIVNFFYAMRGKANSFRFRDWLDYFVIENEIEQTGDGSRRDFQLTKRYATTLMDGSEHDVYHRMIRRPSAAGITYTDINNPLEVTGGYPTIEYTDRAQGWENTPSKYNVGTDLNSSDFNNLHNPSGSDYFAKTGILKFKSAPSAGRRIRWSGFFENHVRFDTDVLNVSLETAQAGDIPDIPLIELRS